jgi:hypothetical protein
MTNLEAIKGKLAYPLSDNAFNLALTDRGLTGTDTYSIDNRQSLELAYADLCCTLISAPNVSEGGYSVSLSDKTTLSKLANGIYAKYGQSSPLRPTAKFVQRW